MSMFNSSMFEAIKDALNKDQEKKNTGLNEIIQFKPGNTYTLRILPFMKDLSKTFFHYYSYGWNSLATGQYVSAVSPETFGARDPIGDERRRVLKMGSEEEKEKMSVIRRTENWLVNVYVVDDPSKPENNGTVKVMRYGRQLDKLIKDAMSGERKDEYGEKIFDISSKGVTFKVKVEKQHDYPWYASSYFTTANGDLNLSEQQQKDIYNKAFALSNIFKIKSSEELQKMLDDHFHCREATSSNSTSSKAVELPKKDDVIAELATKPAVVNQLSKPLTDDELDDLLKDL